MLNKHSIAGYQPCKGLRRRKVIPMKKVQILFACLSFFASLSVGQLNTALARELDTEVSTGHWRPRAIDSSFDEVGANPRQAVTDLETIAFVRDFQVDEKSEKFLEIYCASTTKNYLTAQYSRAYNEKTASTVSLTDEQLKPVTQYHQRRCTLAKNYIGRIVQQKNSLDGLLKQAEGFEGNLKTAEYVGALAIAFIFVGEAVGAAEAATLGSGTANFLWAANFLPVTWFVHAGALASVDNAKSLVSTKRDSLFQDLLNVLETQEPAIAFNRAKLVITEKQGFTDLTQLENDVTRFQNIFMQSRVKVSELVTSELDSMTEFPGVVLNAFARKGSDAIALQRRLVLIQAAIDLQEIVALDLAGASLGLFR